ncbi:unnamed protein product [Eruca vesicaria subsp. sativa]|uniref:RING-type domain-containing protein n=1 Tax=Eruca vesicaria subsp. sativa TaxID=29727 RepID=A0ABC8LAE7_ERUVS|nr:unnamed protein product [Eruca vesicaria subsp. sativa]
MAEEISHVVEFYGINVHTNNDSDMYVTLPGYRVTGSSFTRMIYRPIDGMDVLLSQLRDQEEMYVTHRHAQARTNRESFRQSIAEYPPAARIVPHPFDALAWNWNDTATALSDYVDDSHFNNLTPFVVEGDEAFGTVCLYRQANGWRSGSWLQNPAETLVFRACCICLDDITDTPVSGLLGLQCCQHVFHRACILNWVWKHLDLPSCPACTRLI